jgi:two-component sensor histidine kinase
LRDELTTTPEPNKSHLIMRQVTTLVQVYDSLLGVGLSETVDLGGYLRALCERIPGLQAERSGVVQIVCRAEPVQLGLDAVTALGMVVAELVTNSYKHAFPDRDGTITVTLARAGPDSATLTVGDNGVGYEAEPESTRHGVGLVRRLLERVGGTLDDQSGNGTLWTLVFTVPAVSDGTQVAA